MKRTPFLLKLFLWIVGILLSIALSLSIACIYINKKYDINLFETYAQVKLMAKPVDEDAKYTSKFSADDMGEAKVNVNAKIENLIEYTEEDGYKINKEGLTSSISAELLLPDKQLAAIADTIIKENGGIHLNINGEDVNVELVQIKFDNIDNETGDVEVNIVVKADFSFLQEKMNNFPFSMFKKYVPKTLYISSTTKITKNVGAFNYTVSSKSMTINNLDQAQTANIVKVLNMVAKTGSVEDLNLMVGQQFADLLIGNESVNGFVYSLKNLGVNDYTFKQVDGINYFVVKP